MPTLLLNRTFALVLDDGPACVVCAPRAGVSAGWCAGIAVNADNPYGLWLRDYVRGVPGTLDGREVLIHDALAPATYEAHSCLRSRRAQSACFLVGPGGDIEILGGGGDEDLVLARLNGLTPGALHAARADLPPLEGSVNQAAWAARIRDELIAQASRAGDHELANALCQIRDATWFIASRERVTDELRARSVIGGTRPMGHHP